MKLVVGLGNPGSQYAETRHNIGWMVLDRLADRHGRAGRGRQRDASSVIELRTKGLELILAKPQLFMNESGVPVRKLLASNRVPILEMLVIADDFALPFGKLRFRESGSHGGHNGLRSIIDELGTEKYARLRVGIGEPGRGAIDHVLSKFAPDERTRLPILLDAAAD
ncbi:MAG TPA: aminoacyl-tRNA hydrolase, partial [Candidatus Limnocylindrales bacterium]|nr:aminoacyl-tRNA hydrolase [Candidatus Limnocylindrales bacterium]